MFEPREQALVESGTPEASALAPSIADPNDCVYTPRWATLALVRWLCSNFKGLSQKLRVLDPFAGRGDILRAIHEELPFTWTSNQAWEIRPEEEVALGEVCDEVTIGDWFANGQRWDGWIITNPPYKNGMGLRAVQACYE